MIGNTSFKKIDGCINTFSGNKVNLTHANPDTIDIKDIARGLAFKSHFGGQTPFYFSIADHSILVYLLMLRSEENFDNKMLLLGLLHDASEAYIGDMVKPLKIHLPYYCSVEDNLMMVICKKFGIDYSGMAMIKPFDIEAQSLEYGTFFKGMKLIKGQTPNQSLKMFTKIYNNIINDTVDVNEGAKIFNAASQRKSQTCS